MERLKVARECTSSGVPIAFTFQYGEIKSACVERALGGVLKIYIPVWRD